VLDETQLDTTKCGTGLSPKHHSKALRLTNTSNAVFLSRYSVIDDEQFFASRLPACSGRLQSYEIESRREGHPHGGEEVASPGLSANPDSAGGLQKSGSDLSSTDGESL
jgi:hypothetical protein